MIRRCYLEITNACNLRCSFCTLDKGNDFLELEEIRRILPMIREVTEYLYLHILGEPLLHPHIEEILDLTDELSFKVQLVTNGTLLPDHPFLLSHPSLRKLSVSLHALNEFGSPEAVFKAVERLLSSDRECIVELRFYDKKRLNGPLRGFYEEIMNRYHPVMDQSGTWKLMEKTYLREEELFKWPELRDPFVSERGRCLATEMIAINAKEEVTMCCLDPYAWNSMGNLKEKDLHEILESEKYKELLESLRGNRKLSELCSKCTYRKRFE